MATHRYISTTFWSDDWIDGLSIKEKLFYMFLLTNECTNVAGVYKITKKRMCGDIGYSREEVDTILKKFTDAGKAYYIDEYIILPKWPKHQTYLHPGTKLYAGFLSIAKNLPDNIMAFIADRKHYDYDMSGIEVYKKYFDTEQRPLEISTMEQRYPETPSVMEQRYPKEPSETPFSGDNSNLNLNSNLNSKFNINLGGLSSGRDKTEIAENSESSAEKRPPRLFETVKIKIRALGFFLDNPVALKIADAVPFPGWITATRYTVMDFALEKINAAYPNKPAAEKKKLFVSALCDWQDVRDEYPAWLAEQTKADENRELNRLRDSPPGKCPECGADLKGAKKCPECEGRVLFDEETKNWKYEEPHNFEPLSKQFGKILAGKQQNANRGQAPPAPCEIDFE
jgi:hypothetical protein